MVNYVDSSVDAEDDDGTMPENVAEFADAVIGHRIISAEKQGGTFVIRLDSGHRVELRDDNDCCAYTALDAFLLRPESVDHVITGVTTEDGYTQWHVLADMGDVLSMTVGWSAGNPFYYGYGFCISVKETDGHDA